MNTKHPLLLAAVFALPFLSQADTSFTINNTTADALLSATSPTLNFGSAGTLAIAPASLSKGEFDSVIMFNFASAVSHFDTTYGAGNWQITGLTLSLASNFGVQGAQPNNNIFNTINAGSFGVDWLSYDNWTEGTGGGNGAANGAVSFNSISTLFSAGSSALGTFSHTPPGNNIYVNYMLPLNANLVSDATSGGNVSLYFFAADNQVSYLFNSRESASNHPQFTLTAAPIPEPSAVSLMALPLGGLLLMCRPGKKK